MIVFENFWCGLFIIKNGKLINDFVESLVNGKWMYFVDKCIVG